MNVFDALKKSLAANKAQRAARHAQRQADIAAAAAKATHDKAVAEWQEDLEHAAHALATVQSLTPGSGSSGLMAAEDETIIGWVTGASLIEMRSSGGHYVGGSSGISVPIGSIGGRSVRYRVGRSSGHYEAGTPSPQAVDVGNFYVTDHRLVFVGRKGTRECRLDKTVSMDRSRPGEIIIGVSNRQKNTEVAYGKHLDDTMSFWLDIALARFHGQGDEFAASLQKAYDDVLAAKPSETPSLTTSPAADD